jgi:anti-sigma regulatory factor (Ser/Thr protein kinase)
VPKGLAGSIEEIEPGGLGIQLMKKFATTLRYEQLAQGNRLTLGFQVAPAKPADGTPA